MNLSTPKIMGILNLTPDSFYDGGKYISEKHALLRVEQILQNGATFVDIGGSSTRPNAQQISAEEELNRVLPILEKITTTFPEALISIDTYYSKVATEAVNAGACMVNDVSAGSIDLKLFETIAKLQVPYILSHIKGSFFNRQENITYENLITEVNYFFSEKIKQLHALKVNDIIIDPGFGFGKNIEDNYALLKNLNLLTLHDLPIMVGVSRKSMLYKQLKITAEESLNATSAAHMAALLNGANILRVHDVKEANEVLEIYLAMS